MMVTLLSVIQSSAVPTMLCQRYMQVMRKKKLQWMMCKSMIQAAVTLMRTFCLHMTQTMYDTMKKWITYVHRVTVHFDKLNQAIRSSHKRATEHWNKYLAEKCEKEMYVKFNMELQNQIYILRSQKRHECDCSHYFSSSQFCAIQTEERETSPSKKS